jgi:hypothetical protein
MTNDNTPRAPMDSAPPPSDGGYGKPPVPTRLKQGQSGNPNGRRKKAKRPDLGELILSQANRKLTLDDGRQIGVARLAIRKLIKEAAGGKPAAVRLVFSLLGTAKEKQRTGDAQAEKQRFFDQYVENARQMFREAAEKAGIKPEAADRG